MRPHKLKWLTRIAIASWLAVLASLIYLAFAADARADTVADTGIDREAYAYAAVYGGAVCATLDDYPTVNGVLGVMAAIVDDGLSDFQAGEVVALAVTDICPGHTYLLDLFVDRYNPAGLIA